MPTQLPPPRDATPSRFRAFMASTPPWFQWLTLAAMYGAGIGLMILYFWLVKADPHVSPYAW